MVFWQNGSRNPFIQSLKVQPEPKMSINDVKCVNSVINLSQNPFLAPLISDSGNVLSIKSAKRTSPASDLDKRHVKV